LVAFSVVSDRSDRERREKETHMGKEKGKGPMVACSDDARPSDVFICRGWNEKNKYATNKL